MSITDELREWWVRNFPVMDKELHEEFTAIARSIDAEHQKALDEWKERARPDVAQGLRGVPLLEGNETIASDLEGCGKTIEAVEMRHGRSGWVIISRDGNGYADTFAFTHHHEPTVEDVLRDYASRILIAGCIDEEDELVAEYAAKLRLAEWEEQ